MPKFDCQFHLRSAFTAIATFVTLAGVTFAQAEPAGDVSAKAASDQKAAQPVDQQFRQLLDEAIEVTSKRYLTANSHSPWQVFHYILAMRQESLIRLNGKKVNAIEWLTTSEPVFDKQPLLLLTPHGAKFHPYTKKFFFEGHPAQFLALLSHSNLSVDHPIHVQGKVVTLLDLINNTMKEVNSKEEVTWVLWTLQHFLKSDAAWYNQANEHWSIERLVQIESAAPVVGAPCGGNHRLFALTRARDKYLLSGGALRGVWFQADQKIKQHIEIARSLQNADGSFSSEWYKGPAQSTDVNLRFNTSGHTMEFLAVSLPKERLHEQWVRNAVWMLSRELVLNQNAQIDCGPLFHSLDALILYRDRIRLYGPPIPTNSIPLDVALKPGDAAANRILKTTPEPNSDRESLKPVPEARSASKPPEVADVPADAKPLNSKPSPSVPIPIPDRLMVPELKSAEPKLEAPKAPERKEQPANNDVTAKRNETKMPSLPKIDLSKLANIGQVAPTAKLVEPKTDHSDVAQKNSPLPLAPALLPEESATPLGELILRKLNPLPATVSTDKGISSAREISTAREIEKPAAVDVPNDQASEPSDAEAATDTEADQPASALDVANPST